MPGQRRWLYAWITFPQDHGITGLAQHVTCGKAGKMRFLVDLDQSGLDRALTCGNVLKALESKLHLAYNEVQARATRITFLYPFRALAIALPN